MTQGCLTRLRLFNVYRDDVVMEMEGGVNCKGDELELKGEVWKVAICLYTNDVPQH